MRVSLVIYDLSRGMAGMLSQSILGERIEAIYHTGIAVFGREYFFGGGIQSLSENEFGLRNQLPPIRIESMGETRKTINELEAYLRSISSQFTQQTYNLLTHNCNNFSDVVCKFLTGHGIPKEIVDLPARVFSTPGGLALRPLFEQMQAQMSVMAGDPFSHMSNSSTINSTSSRVGGMQSQHAQSAEFSTGDRQSPRGKPIVRDTGPPEVKIVLEESPLLSVDASSVGALGKKIIKSCEEIFSKEEVSLLEVTISSLSSSTTSAERDYNPQVFTILRRVLQTVPNSQLACFFILRLLVTVDRIPNEGNLTILHIAAMLQNEDAHGGTGFHSKAAKVLALCTLANWLSHSRHDVIEDEALVAIATKHMFSESVEIRQIAAALCYNLVLHAIQRKQWRTVIQDEIHPLAVQVLCTALEGIDAELDPSSIFRRVAIAHRIVVSYNHDDRVTNPCCDLITEIGFDASLHQIKSQAASGSQIYTLIDSLLSHVRNNVHL